jgi:hypothetical protein
LTLPIPMLIKKLPALKAKDTLTLHAANTPEKEKKSQKEQKRPFSGDPHCTGLTRSQPP